jgi:mono/diheme cytochrome c family protein
MIGRGSKLIGACAAAFLVIVGASVAGTARDAQAKQAATHANAGWALPPEAETTKSPLTVDDKVLATGRAIYKDKCQRCHGPGGLGDGPDSDPDAREDMDLTNPERADKNPDGVVFFKVMNGRRRPKMPAFKEELSPEQVWSVVAHVQTIRRK